MKQLLYACFLIVVIATVSFACKKTSTTNPVVVTATVPDVFKKFNAAVQTSSDGNFITIKSNGIPDHKSPYFATSDTRYEAYNGSNPAYIKNPNSIITQSLTFKIPVNPAVNSTHSATPLGPIGVSINGVPLFNQYAGPAVPLTNEINSFDQYNGHPQMSGQYHYHVEPLFITATKGKSALIGFLLDGFPVYGPLENGITLTSANLDVYHGHTGVTADYPGGIYHYHTTADAPYLNGSGFYGTAGTVTQ